MAKEKKKSRKKDPPATSGEGGNVDGVDGVGGDDGGDDGGGTPPAVKLPAKVPSAPDVVDEEETKQEIEADEAVDGNEYDGGEEGGNDDDEENQKGQDEEEDDDDDDGKTQTKKSDPPASTSTTQKHPKMAQPTPNKARAPAAEPEPEPAPTPEPSKDNNNKKSNGTNDLVSNKLVLVCIGILVGVVIAGVVAIILALILRNNDDGDDPSPQLLPTPAPPGPTPLPVSPDSPSPTTQEEIVLLDLFSTVVGDDVFIEGTPQYSAAQWMLKFDPRLSGGSATIATQQAQQQEQQQAQARQGGSSGIQTALTEDEWIQRYILVFLYFSTTNNLQSEWLSCNAPTNAANEVGNSDENIDDVCDFRVPTPVADDGIDLVYAVIPNSIRWLTAGHECSWAGVSCIEIDMNDDGVAAQQRQSPTTVTRQVVTGLSLGKVFFFFQLI